MIISSCVNNTYSQNHSAKIKQERANGRVLTYTSGREDNFDVVVVTSDGATVAEVSVDGTTMVLTGRQLRSLVRVLEKHTSLRYYY